MKKEFVIRGQLASGLTETIEFGGYKEGYAYILTDFKLWGSSIGTINTELSATLTAAKTFEDPTHPNFNNEGLIGTALFQINSSMVRPTDSFSIVNDTFLITQNLILAVIDTEVGSPAPVNYHMRFKSVKMTDSQAAATNFKQFSIFDE
jgi:hypothetical protein